MLRLHRAVFMLAVAWMTTAPPTPFASVAQASQCRPEPMAKPRMVDPVWVCNRWVSGVRLNRCRPSPGYRRGFVWVCNHWERPRARPPGPVIRDHRGGPVIRDHRGGPVIRDHRGGPVIRDHREKRYFTDPHF